MTAKPNRINVTKTFLPPIEEYEAYLHQIWDNVQLTNQGPLLHEFEEKMSAYLGVENFHFVTNGTLALQISLKALGIEEGEVITTPFSYVATTTSILWERCTPVFVDIDPKTFCIDPDKLEAAITKDTKAIMPVHVYGNPCDVERIQEIAKKHNLKVIYDAAHAFGVTYKGRSLMSYGDISVGSFHATKLFHTIEGGAIIVRDKKVSDKIELLKRFGHNNDDYYMVGTNAKATEFQAAMGLCMLRYIDEIQASRKEIMRLYDAFLDDSVQRLHGLELVNANGAYYPVVMESETVLLGVLKRLNERNIFPRRYFYPSLNTLPYLKGPRASCPISEDIASRVMCLPLYAGLGTETIKEICEVVNK